MDGKFSMKGFNNRFQNFCWTSVNKNNFKFCGPRLSQLIKTGEQFLNLIGPVKAGNNKRVQQFSAIRFYILGRKFNRLFGFATLMKKATSFIKSFILYLRPGLWLGFLSNPFQWAANVLKLSKWIAQNPVKGLNDFYSPGRDYSKRYKLYDDIVKQLQLENEPVDYLEFGVSKGLSFKWWLSHNQNPDSRFYGFDTFEGLPEKWGTFSKGSMAAEFPEIRDSRGEFIKGLFQDTLPEFLKEGKIKSGKQKIIHLDADLFSSTLFALTTLHTIIHRNDILIFDEFNVPTHEFMAFTNYVESYYVKYEVLAAVNNYFQVAIRII